MGVRFMGNGYGQFSESQAVESVAIEFRTSQLAALLLHIDSQVAYCITASHVYSYSIYKHILC